MFLQIVLMLCRAKQIGFNIKVTYTAVVSHCPRLPLSNLHFKIPSLVKIVFTDIFDITINPVTPVWYNPVPEKKVNPGSTGSANKYIFNWLLNITISKSKILFKRLSTFLSFTVLFPLPVCFIACWFWKVSFGGLYSAEVLQRQEQTSIFTKIKCLNLVHI